MKVLMVCLGNICRSPLAEGILRHKALENGLDWKVDSAGLGDWQVGNPPYRLARKVSLKNGIDISKQQARLFVPEDLGRFDRVYFMDLSNLEGARKKAGGTWDDTRFKLLMDEVYPLENREVPDPYGHPEEEFDLVFKMIDSACEAIIQKYSQDGRSGS